MWVINVFLYLCLMFNPTLYATFVAAGCQMWNYVPGLANATTSSSAIAGSNHALQGRLK